MHFPLPDALSLHVRVFLLHVLLVNPEIIAFLLQFVVFDLASVVLFLGLVEFHNVLAQALLEVC